jgi:two-component system, NarL family, response regulator LiaR
LARFESSPQPSVVLVDDHELVRAALRSILERGEVEVIGEAETGEQGIGLATELSPDVVLMDLSLPDFSGIEATRRLMKTAPRSNVLVVTGSAEEHDVHEAYEAGACGYLLKDAEPDELLAGVRRAALGERVVPRH